MKVEPDGTWAWAVIGARFGAYSGYKRAKAKGYTGWRKWGTIAGSAAIGSVGSFKAAGYATRFVIRRVSITIRKPNLLIGAYAKTGKRKGFPYLAIHKHDVASQMVHRVKNKNIKGPVKRWHYHFMGKAHRKIPFVTMKGVKGYKWRK